MTLSQIDLATDAGVGLATLQRAERGDPVTAGTAAAIGKALNVDYKTISIPKRRVSFFGYFIEEDQVDRIVFSGLQLAEVLLTIVIGTLTVFRNRNKP